MSNTLLIYNQLRASGASHAGALGLMGNWMAESDLEPWRLQNDFTAARTLSHAYTADVMAGRIRRATVWPSGPTSISPPDRGESWISTTSGKSPARHWTMHPCR